MKRSVFILLSLILILFIPFFSIVGAQNQVEIINQSVDYDFGSELVFQIEFNSDSPLESLVLFIQAGGIPTFVGSVTVNGDNQGYFVYDLSQRPLPAFANISYYYQFTLSNGETVNSPDYNFTYFDNRFNWQELIEEPFRIFWYEGEIILAQEVLDAAISGKEKVLELLQQPPDNQPISIFIYNSEEDLQSSLTSIGQNWVSGQANPALGSVVVALPPAVDQPLEIQRLIPHELTHIYLYRFMGAEYDYLPTWFSEGLASSMEAYNLPEYDLILQRAKAENDLIPFLHICLAFPTDPDLALQSYAQSNSLVKYIRRQYGLPALQSLIIAYDQGVSCERGVETALGMTLADLEKEWQQVTFGGGKVTLLIYILVAVLLVLVLLLAMFIITTIRSNPDKDDWGDEDDFPGLDGESELGRGEDHATGSLEEVFDLRMDEDE